MNRQLQPGLRRIGRVPRACGDEPQLERYEKLREKCSPRLRG